MAFVLILGTIIVGAMFGYFLATPAIIVLSLIAAVLAFFTRPAKHGGLESLAGVVVWILIGLATACMWGVHWYVTGTLTDE
jgi:hypothetical protein